MKIFVGPALQNLSQFLDPVVALWCHCITSSFMCTSDHRLRYILLLLSPPPATSAGDPHRRPSCSSRPRPRGHRTTTSFVLVVPARWRLRTANPPRRSPCSALRGHRITSQPRVVVARLRAAGRGDPPALSFVPFALRPGRRDQPVPFFCCARRRVIATPTMSRFVLVCGAGLTPQPV